MDTKLSEMVAVVTGGNSGIGRAIATLFATEGARVVIFGRDVSTLDDTVRAIGPAAWSVQGDVSRLGDLERLFKETAAREGDIDVLVVNAGVARFARLADTDETLFDEISDVNFKGAFFTVQKALPHLRDGASVILVASSAQQMGMKSFSAYSATKAAVRSLARTFAAELLARGIRVNALSPGPTDTPILSRGDAAVTAGDAADTASSFPFGRMARPDEIAQAALFLATSASSYMTGAELTVDGGLSVID